MKTKVFINGGEGTTGLRIADRLATRADIELLKIDSELRKDPVEVAKKINESDITFFCLPDAASIEAAALVTNEKTCIIDASTAHRTNPDWAYGFPELGEEFLSKIKKSNRIAVPGCHASGVLSLLYPLTSTGLIDKDALVSVFSISGYSGAGKKTIAVYEADDRVLTNKKADAEGGVAPQALDAPRPYALKQEHKHLKEIKAISGLNNAPVFSPIIADYYSGMLVTLPLHTAMLNKESEAFKKYAKDGKFGAEEFTAFFADFYKGKELVKVLPADCELIASNFLPANGVSGKDYMEVFACGNDERITLCSRFDNLGKGASGAAIECMNIKLGADVTSGLDI